MQNIKQQAQQLFQSGNNCAEALIAAANADCPPELFHAMGAFGGGMGCEKTCGALCGAVARIGAAAIKTTAHQTPEAKALTARFVLEFERAFGSTECGWLKQRYLKEGERCVWLVGETAALLEQYIEQINEGTNC